MYIVYFKSGVYHNLYSQTNLDRGVLAVGYEFDIWHVYFRHGVNHIFFCSQTNLGHGNLAVSYRMWHLACTLYISGAVSTTSITIPRLVFAAVGYKMWHLTCTLYISGAVSTTSTSVPRLILTVVSSPLLTLRYVIWHVYFRSGAYYIFCSQIYLDLGILIVGKKMWHLTCIFQERLLFPN